VEERESLLFWKADLKLCTTGSRDKFLEGYKKKKKRESFLIYRRSRA